MDVPIMTMDAEAAANKASAYKKFERLNDPEYEAAARAYEAMANGLPLINLVQAIQQGGLGADGRPRLAVARADRKQVEVTVSAWDGVPRGHIRFNATSPNFHRLRSYSGSLVFDVPWQRVYVMSRGYTLVPMIPADVRPLKLMLRQHFILWEVEAWSSSRLQAEPDYDPLLLRRIHGDLYAVIAEWDLTELERAIMAGRRFD